MKNINLRKLTYDTCTFKIDYSDIFFPTSAWQAFFDNSVPYFRGIFPEHTICRESNFTTCMYMLEELPIINTVFRPITNSPHNFSSSEDIFISGNVKVDQVFQYSGENYLSNHPTYNKIVAEENYSSIGEGIPFMPSDIEEYNEYINETSINGYLINGPKALVTIAGIKDILANGKNNEGRVTIALDIVLKHNSEIVSSDLNKYKLEPMLSKKFLENVGYCF
ncbi:hypothetical protein Glove_490g50 [Diversispora epigaea]|uniref:Uncharacterized protein n=1 Tax=Diversispora epigaea TaxID=1348612 RepID=A0A397GMC6_9GLOM|nr:hypothetical protein Glove_490g50 [Diversispora epigaea]